MIPDKIYLIHYTKLAERLPKILPILDRCGIPYEIITQYDKEDINSEMLLSYFDVNETNFINKVSALWDSNIHKYRHLNMAEISCTLKHFIAFNKLAKECPNFGMVIEDDVVFSDSFADSFRKRINETPNDWDAIWFGEGCGMSYINTRLANAKKITDNVYLMNHPATNCAESYLLKPSMAKTIYDSLPFNLVSDWEIAYQLFKHDAKVYWWIPPLISQGSKNGTFKSELDMGQRG